MKSKKKAELKNPEKVAEQLGGDPGTKAQAILTNDGANKGKEMKDQEAQEYITKLLTGASEGLDGAEAICFQEWRGVVKNLEQASKSLTQAQAEAKRLEGIVLHLQGQREAYFRTLILTEEGRRNAANSKPKLVPDEVPNKEENKP